MQGLINKKRVAIAFSPSGLLHSGYIDSFIGFKQQRTVNNLHGN